jgi:hypothetical protein
MAMVRVWYQQEIPSPKPGRQVTEVMHADAYDKSKLRDVKQFIEKQGMGQIVMPAKLAVCPWKYRRINRMRDLKYGMTS